MESASTWGAFSSRLGKKVISLLLLASILPLFIFGGVIYFQSTTLLRQQSLDNMENYVNATGDNIFASLRQAEHLISEARVEDGQVQLQQGGERYFNKLFVTDYRGRDINTGEEKINIDSRRREWLEQGRPTLSETYQKEKFYTTAVIYPTEENLIVGEIELKQLWEALRPSYFNSRDVVFVANSNYRLIASLSDEFPFTGLPEQLRAGIPEDRGGARGSSRLEELSEEYAWTTRKLWLEGRYGIEPWHVFILRPERVVSAFPRQILRTLVIFFALAVLIFVFVANRFSHHILAPIVDMHRAIFALEDEEFLPALPVDRDDELGELARHMDNLRDRLRDKKVNDRP